MVLKDTQKLSGLAVASLAIGVLGFIIFPAGPVAIMVGSIALFKIKRSGGSLRGAPLAIAGIVAAFMAMIFAGSAIMGLQYRAYKIPTGSMAPAIKAKDRIVVDLAAYRASGPGRGDIVVYELLDKGKRRFMCKRVVALPGEEVEIASGRVRINSAVVAIAGLSDGVRYLNTGAFGAAGQPVKVPAGFYYVLGDNPAGSFDSRQHGPVDVRDIKGRYLFSYKIFPFKLITELFRRG